MLRFNWITNKIRELKFIKKAKDTINDIPPLMRFQKTTNYFNIANFIIENSAKTKELLDSKGFSYDIEDRPEKIALLQTEVSELIDAFKKGRVDEEEGEELADIVIRLMSIPCMYFDVASFLVEIIDKHHNDIITLTVSEVSKFDTVRRVKYFVTYMMFKMICTLDDKLLDLEFVYSKKQTTKKGFGKTAIEEVAYMMAMIVLICQIYAEDILKANLQDLINKKMQKNRLRPYRYNTAPELFS
jgi:NTP pyrophosphatase (non-canonical NTP hydrolase)